MTSIQEMEPLVSGTIQPIPAEPFEPEGTATDTKPENPPLEPETGKLLDTYA